MITEDDNHVKGSIMGTLDAEGERVNPQVATYIPLGKRKHSSETAKSQVTITYDTDPYKPDYRKPKKIEGMELIWNDEFNKAGKPDPSNWDYESGFIRGTELQWYQRDNARVEKGCLIIEARKEKVKNPNPDPTSKENRAWASADYTSSSLITKGKQEWLFGRFEIRARIDSVKGYWNDIWTLGTTREWPSGGEIDIMEFNRATSKPTVNASIITQLNESGSPKYNVILKPLSDFTSVDADWIKKFHVWRMDWNKDSISIYIDGMLMKRVLIAQTVGPDGFSPFLHPQYLLLNLAVGSYGGDVSNTKFPLKFEVDYARVYQENKK